jgi:outer membrane protein
MRPARLSTIAMAAVVGCLPATPYTNGVPAAPPASNLMWRAPRAARAIDSLGASRSLSAGLATRGTALTLADVVALALRNNPATRLSWAQALAAANTYGMARGAYFPTMTGVVDGGRADQPASGNAGAGLRTSYGPSLSLHYLLLDFGGRRGTVQNARESTFAVAYTHNRVVQSTVLQVEEAYFGYVSARGLRDAQRAALVEAQASYEAARGRDSVGLATIGDVLQARTALAQAQLQLQITEGQLRSAWSALALAINIPPTAPYDVAACADDVEVGAVTASVDSLIDVALRERPDLQAAHATVAAARADVRSARAAALPSLALAAGNGYAHSSLRPLTGRSYSLSLSVQIPLFDGGAKEYGIARAQALADVAAAQAAAQRQTVIGDVYTAYYDLQTAAQQVRTSDELLESATASVRAARARYTGGVGSIVDLLTAQAALADARAQQAQSRGTWAQALARLGYASGTLDINGHSALPVSRDTVRSSPRPR